MAGIPFSIPVIVSAVEAPFRSPHTPHTLILCKVEAPHISIFCKVEDVDSLKFIISALTIKWSAD